MPQIGDIAVLSNGGHVGIVAEIDAANDTLMLVHGNYHIHNVTGGWTCGPDCTAPLDGGGICNGSGSRITISTGAGSRGFGNQICAYLRPNWSAASGVSNGIKSYSIACPVDVLITYDGEVLDSATGQSGTSFGTMATDETDSISAQINGYYDTQTVINGIGVGTMDFTATYQDEDGTRKPVIMGSYGIGVGRLLACIAEEHNDEAGLALPVSVAPYQVHLISLIKDTAVAESVYESLQNAGIDVLYDDRKESAGVKFADADLIGIPVRITIGNRSLKEGKVEVKIRTTGETTSFLVEDLADEVKAELAKLQKEIDDNIVEKELN